MEASAPGDALGGKRHLGRAGRLPRPGAARDSGGTTGDQWPVVVPRGRARRGAAARSQHPVIADSRARRAPRLPAGQLRRGTDYGASSDEELVARCTGGTNQCLEELLKRYDQRIQACARQMALSRSEVEDLVQMTVLHVISALPSFHGESAFGTWLYRVAHNTCVDAFRRASRDRARTTGLEASTAGDSLEWLRADWGDPEDELDRDRAACYTAWLLSRLRPEQRAVVQLRLIDGFSTAETALLLHTTPDGVKARLRRARALLHGIVESGAPCPSCGRVPRLPARQSKDPGDAARGRYA